MVENCTVWFFSFYVLHTNLSVANPSSSLPPNLLMLQKKDSNSLFSPRDCDVSSALRWERVNIEQTTWK